MSLQLGFLVKQPGMLSLVQDIGRFGSFNIGLTNGGPMDKHAFYWANRLCGNDLEATTIEITVGGLSLIAQVDSIISITGATMPLHINGRSKCLWRTYHIKAGDIIELGYAVNGLRSYLAVNGGFDIPEVFGSTATVNRENIGGISGGKLLSGDILPCKTDMNKTKNKNNVMLPEEFWPMYKKDLTLHTIPSYQQHSFSSHSQRLFFTSEYTVSKNCDRMGYRLEGRAIKSDIDGILSEGICQGAIQIPADGQPIVLLNDRQTIGGYPKIGAVISGDTAKLSQVTQGAKIHFEPISMEKAHNMYHLSLSRFQKTQMVTCD